MPLPTLEVQQLTADSVDFSPKELRTFLRNHDPYDHLASWIVKDRIHRSDNPKTWNSSIVDVPGRDDVILRPGTSALMLLDHTLEYELVAQDEEIPRYVSLHEAELGRLATFGITIPRHNVFFVPNDPYFKMSMLYTVVEKLGNILPLDKSDYHDQTSEYHSAARAVHQAFTSYYRSDAPEGWYISELEGVFQANTDKVLFEVEPCLINGSARELAELDKYTKNEHNF